AGLKGELTALENLALAAALDGFAAGPATLRAALATTGHRARGFDRRGTAVAGPEAAPGARPPRAGGEPAGAAATVAARRTVGSPGSRGCRHAGRPPRAPPRPGRRRHHRDSPAGARCVARAPAAPGAAMNRSSKASFSPAPRKVPPAAA